MTSTTPLYTKPWNSITVTIQLRRRSAGGPYVTQVEDGTFMTSLSESAQEELLRASGLREGKQVHEVCDDGTHYRFIFLSPPAIAHTPERPCYMEPFRVDDREGTGALRPFELVSQRTRQSARRRI